MHPLAIKAIEDVQAAGIIVDPVRDFERLRTVQDLATATVAAIDEATTRCLLVPCRGVGDVVLYRPSIGARAFMRAASSWFAGDPVMSDFAILYVLAHSNKPESSMWPYHGNREAFARVVIEWAGDKRVAYADAIAAARKLLQDEERGGPSNPSHVPAWGRIVERLCQEYGRTPDDWIWRTPEAQVAAVLDALALRQEEAARAAGGAVAVDGYWFSSLMRLKDYIAQWIREAQNDKA